jgi:hypothetical protein
MSPEPLGTPQSPVIGDPTLMGQCYPSGLLTLLLNWDPNTLQPPPWVVTGTLG